MVTVKVGSEAEVFNLYRDLICKASPYFQGAFKGKFVEAQDLLITLDDVSVRTFAILQTWMYFGRLILPSDSDAYLEPVDLADDVTACDVCGLPLTEAGSDCNWMEDILKLYILADKSNFPLFRRQIMIECQHLSEVLNCFPPMPAVIHAYDNLPETSPFIKYMIQMYKSCWQPMGLLKNCPCQKAMLAQIESGQIPHSFIDQVMIHSHHRNDDPTLKTGKVDWCEFQ